MNLQDVTLVRKNPETGVWEDGDTVTVVPSQVVSCYAIEDHTVITFTDGNALIVKPNIAAVKVFLAAA